MSKRANGEGTIYYNEKKNKYVGQISVGYDEKGKRKRKTVYGDTPADVQKKLKNIEFRIYTGEFVDRNGITIYHLAKQMLDDKLSYNEIKPATYFCHSETLRRLEPIYNVPIQAATESQIKEFLAHQQRFSQSCLNKDYGLLKKTFDEAVRRSIIIKNPMLSIRKPKSKKISEKVRAFTIEEQNKLLTVLQNEDIKYSRQMLLSMLTGMRMGEINALAVSDINLTFNTVSINRTISRGEKGRALLSDTTKTYAGKRQIPVTEDVKAILRECVKYKGDGLVFTTDKGGMITTNQVNMVLSRILKKYDIIDETILGKVSCHSFRHTYATRCIEGGMQPKVLQLLLGHTDIRITLNTYCSAFDNFQSENIEKVNEYLQSLGLTIQSA